MEHAPAFLAIVNDAKSRIREVTIDEVIAKLRSLAEGRAESFELVDVREDHEWQQGRIKGARHLGRGILERDIEKAIPDKDREIVLYCGGGFRSALAADNLQKMGYTDAISLDGGWRAWTGAGLPVEK